MKQKKAVRAAFPHTIPVLAGFLVLGIAYGVLMKTKGYGIVWAVLMSAIAFCGSMQFVAITLLTTAFHPLQAFLLSILVNARHLFYGISMLERYKGFGKKARFCLIYMLCDETFSLSYSVVPPEGVEAKDFYLAISILDYSYWVIGTAMGSLLGNLIPFNTAGLDFALTALFVVLFLEQWKERKNRIPELIGMGATIVSLFLFGTSNFVIVSMVLILGILLLGRKRLCS